MKGNRQQSPKLQRQRSNRTNAECMHGPVEYQRQTKTPWAAISHGSSSTIYDQTTARK